MSPQAGLEPAIRRLTAESNRHLKPEVIGLDADCVNGAERSEMEKKTALKDFQSSAAAPFSNRWI
jgi:hypothetical protein